MAGTIRAQSRVEEGSLFSVRLPLARTIVAPAAPEPQADPAPRELARVLLVEDHPINQKVVKFILEAQGLEVILAENGALGVEAFQTGRYDLILMDMQMPVMDGLTATRAIRAFEAVRPGGCRTPIAMLTANALPEHRDLALAAGADVHIPKPVTPESLLAGIDRLLAVCDQTAAA